MIIYTSDLNKTKKELISIYGIKDFNIENIALRHRITLKGKKSMYFLRITKLKEPGEYMVEFN